MKNDLYPMAYNCWSGNPNGNRPDFTRCCVEVVPNERGGSWHQHQCARKRGFGPDEAYCKQHDPVATAAREKASQERYYADMNKRRYEWSAKQFFAVLEQIAAGHNDPRTLAKETIDKFLAGAYGAKDSA